MADRRGWGRIDFVMLPLLALLAIASVCIVAQRLALSRQIAARVVREPAVAAALRQQIGEPVKVGFFVSGRVIGGMDGGTADLTIPVSGPRGHGKIVGWFQTCFGGWHGCSVDFVSGTGQRVEVLPDATSTCERE